MIELSESFHTQWEKNRADSRLKTQPNRFPFADRLNEFVEC